MIHFKSDTISGEEYLWIYDGDKPMPGRETRLRVHRPLVGQLTETWPKLVNSLHKSEWTRRYEDTKVSDAWVLHSAHRQSQEDISSLPTLGYRISQGDAQWRDHVDLVGEFKYFAGFWEWSEDILSRCEDDLRRTKIYDSVYASLFLYDRSIEIMKEFCEAWSLLTNTLLTSHGEMSLSLRDLHVIVGLPTGGMLYDEVIPSVRELIGTPHRCYLPNSCNYLFRAYHLLLTQHGKVSIEEWIKFWSKKKAKYSCPPARVELKKKNRSRPSGQCMRDLPPHAVWTEVDLAPFVKLGVKDKYREETFFAAYIACWLCYFVLPDGDTRLLRPETFKMASLMAVGRRVVLTVPVLTSIYKGLNAISRSPDPSHCRIALPFHFVYSWIAHYFKTHFPTKRLVPRMTQFSGEGGARFYDAAEARRRIQKGEQVSWTCTMPDKHIMYVDGDKTTEVDGFIFMAIRSGYLANRQGDHFLIEPYNPYRFSRQFGYYQMVTGSLIEDMREADLITRLRLWRICILQRSGSKAFLSSSSPNAKKFISSSFKKWLDQLYKNSFGETAAVAPYERNDDQKAQEKGKAVASSKRKTPEPASTDLISSNHGSDDRHWKRNKSDMPPESVQDSIGDTYRQMDDALAKAMETVLGSPTSEDSTANCASAGSTHSVDIYQLDDTDAIEPTASVAAISRFDGRAVFDNHCRTFLEGVWRDLLSKIKKTPTKYLSSIRDDVVKSLLLMENTPHSFDLSHLRKSINTLFANAASYDLARSASFDFVGAPMQRAQEVKKCIEDVEVKKKEEDDHIESSKREIADLDEEDRVLDEEKRILDEKQRIVDEKKRIVDEKKKISLLSLAGHETSSLAAGSKIKDLKEELSKINATFNEEIHKSLKSSRFLVEKARKALEDQNPFA